MHAMVLASPRTPLAMRERPVPAPGRGEILIAVSARGVCRTDLHVVDGELPDPKLPVVPGQEIVGTNTKFDERWEGTRLRRPGPAVACFMNRSRRGLR